MNVYKDDNILAHRLDIAAQKGKQEGIQIGEERGIQIGEERGRRDREIELAKAMLTENMEINTVAKLTGLAISEVEQLGKKP